MTTPTSTRRLSELAELSNLWLDADNSWRANAIQALVVSTGMSAEQVGRALKAAFSELTLDKLQDFYESEAGFRHANPPSSVLHILAGNVFTSWVPGALITLLLGARCALKPSSNEPVFPRLWRESLTMINPSLAQDVEIVAWTESLAKQYGAVVAYGDDGTLEAIRMRVPASTPFIGYGHKVSVGIFGAEALKADQLPAWIERLVADVLPFKLDGCLSPRLLFVEGDIAVLKAALSRVTTPIPDFRPFRSWPELFGLLAPVAGRLSAVGYAGDFDRIRGFQKQLSELGVTRICGMGEMQRPPLSWRNGGFSLVDRLVSPAPTNP